MTAVYLVVGAGVLGWRCARIGVATALQVPIALGTAAALVLQRYVAEIDDEGRSSCPSPSTRA